MAFNPETLEIYGVANYEAEPAIPTGHIAFKADEIEKRILDAQVEGIDPAEEQNLFVEATALAVMGLRNSKKDH